jgi:energy-coupling factor transporter ATP-binding protein EcfA2
MKVPLGNVQTPAGEQPFTIDLSREQFRHGWVLGKSGTGKSTLLRHIIAAAMREGKGLAVIDPHGDLIFDAFNYIPKDRLKDVVYLDPENTRIPDIGILDHPDKTRALRVFMTLLEAHSGTAWGKQTASILRSITRAALEIYKHPTIVQIYLLLADDEYANAELGKCKNPLTQKFHEQYWSFSKKDRIEKFSHPLNKIEELMEPGLVEFLSQTKSLNFRKLMDEQKIVLCRIPKSYLEERGARILGSFIMMKFKVEATRRKKRKKQFFIIADEFHNFTAGINVDTTFGESRKYGTHYIVTSQTRKQLGENADVIAGNVSHIIAFRMSATDAEEIEKNIGSRKEDFSELVMIPNYSFRALTMDDGQPIPSNSVKLFEFPELTGQEVPARKAIAWASENTGTEKEIIQKQIQEALRN